MSDLYTTLAARYGVPRDLVKTLVQYTLFSNGTPREDLLRGCRVIVERYQQRTGWRHPGSVA